MMNRNMEPNAREFDCRRYIKPGDRVDYSSMKACDEVQSIDRRIGSVYPYSAYVTAVYETFVMIKLKKITESVNRWDIQKINGKPVGNEVGYFGKV